MRVFDPAPWKDHGACRGRTDITWFPGRGDNAGATAARRVCYQCPVIDQCREYALARNDTGIWGGLSDKQREAERRRRRRHARREEAA